MSRNNTKKIPVDFEDDELTPKEYEKGCAIVRRLAELIVAKWFTEKRDEMDEDTTDY